MFAALALAIAGVESLLSAPPRKPGEPTHSLGAVAIVLAAHQAGDAPRLLVLAIAVATHAPIPAAVGGAIGGSAVIALGWSTPEFTEWRGLKTTRRIVGGLLLALAIAVTATA
jgi:hypothetical protein